MTASNINNFVRCILICTAFCRFRHGAQDRVYRLEFVSNQDFSDSEFFAWRETIMLSGMMMPTLQEVEKKMKDIQEAMAYRLTENDINEVNI